MKLLKPALVILFVLALTYTVMAGQTQSTHIAHTAENTLSLPVHGDLLFAFTAIFSLSGYLIFKK